MTKERQIVVPFSELIDMLSIDQIKEILKQNKDISHEMKMIEHDLDLFINDNEMKLTSRSIRLIIALSQINLHIWMNKDKMTNTDNKDEYCKYLKFSHQLNGIRNQIKNILNRENGFNETKTNINIDGLEGWNISI